MNNMRRSIWLAHLVSALTFGAIFSTNALGTTFTVTNTNDSGTGSLRQAILDANALSGPDIICFDIGSGTQTIAPLSPLPEIADVVTIDGTTQPGFISTPIINSSDSFKLQSGHIP